MASDLLTIRISNIVPTVQETVDWALLSAAGSALGEGSSPLSKLAQQVEVLTDDYRLLVMMPGEVFLFANIASPAKNRRQLRQTLPFLVEELLAEDIEKVHMALPDSVEMGVGHIDVAIVKHELLINWLDCLYHCGLAAKIIVADALCVPFWENQWTLLLDDAAREGTGRLLLRTGKFRSYALKQEDAGLMIGALMDEKPVADVPATLKILYSRSGGNEVCARELADELLTMHPSLDVELSYLDGPVFSTLLSVASHQRATEQEINLLQGGYSAAAPASGTGGVSVFATPIRAAAVLLLVYLVFVIGSGWLIDRRADTLRAQTVTLYRELFPNDRRVISPRKQMENHLVSAGGTGSRNTFLALLAQSADELSQNGNEGLKIEALRFNNDNSALQMQVQASSISTLEKLKQSLSQRDLTVAVRSAVENADNVVARLEIRQ